MSSIAPSMATAGSLVEKAAGFAVRWKKALMVVGVVGATVLLTKRARRGSQAK